MVVLNISSTITDFRGVSTWMTLEVEPVYFEEKAVREHHTHMLYG